MVECFRCGVYGESKELLECVYKDGIIFLCHNCYPKFRLPIIENKSVDWEKVEQRVSVHKKMEKISGVEGGKETISSFGKTKLEDVSLRDLVEKNFIKNKVYAKEIPTNLIDNFNWVVMRKRREKRISTTQFSEKIKEPEKIIRDFERGILPRDYEPLVKKIEYALNLNLFKEKPEELTFSDIVTESRVPTGLSVLDIKKRSKGFFNWFSFKKQKIENDLTSEKESDLLQNEDLNIGQKDKEFIKNEFEEKSKMKEVQNKENFNIKEVKYNKGIDQKEKEDLSSEEIDKLIWRK